MKKTKSNLYQSTLLSFIKNQDFVRIFGNENDEENWELCLIQAVSSDWLKATSFFSTGEYDGEMLFYNASIKLVEANSKISQKLSQLNVERAMPDSAHRVVCSIQELLSAAKLEKFFVSIQLGEPGFKYYFTGIVVDFDDTAICVQQYSPEPPGFQETALVRPDQVMKIWWNSPFLNLIPKMIEACQHLQASEE